MKTKTIKLKYDPTHDYAIIAIVTPLNDLSFSWTLNTSIGLNLKHSGTYKPLDTEGATTGFSIYSYIDEENMLEFVLLSNKSKDGVLIKKYSQIDFFLKVSGDFLKHFIQKIVKDVADVSDVTFTSILDLDDMPLKSKKVFENLLS